MTTIAPIFASPCDPAKRLPAMIADFLDIEQQLKRRFREDSITDILIASLLSLPGKQVVVLTPNEAKTGGDFDLVLVDPGTGDAVQFRIQAKRLTPHLGTWQLGSYRELAHPHNSGAQSRLLVSKLSREAIPTIPLYAFYNPAGTCAASGASVSGVELASALEIRELIKLIVRVKPKRLPFKRIGVLQPLFFPLSTILCPPAGAPAGRAVPLPSQARQSVDREIERRVSAVGSLRSLEIAEARPRRLKSDDASGDRRQPRLPAIVQAAIERRGERIIRARLPRPLVVLVSEEK